jgi:predicted nucleic acid-binding protein
MKHLLDVSTLLALLLENHPFHLRVTTWAQGKTLAVCPIAELGFIRIATSSAYGATMLQARNTLACWLANDKPEFIAADLRALDGEVAPSSGKTTDWYLANLAAMHGMQWATLDTRADHPAATVIE